MLQCFKNSFQKAIVAFSFISVFFISIVGCSKINEPESPVDPGKIVSLEIVQLPLKKNYYLNEPFSMEGLIIQAKYDQGKTKEIVVSTTDIAGFNSAQAVKNQLITVSKHGFSVQFTIDVYPFVVEKNRILKAYLEDQEEVVIPEGIETIAAEAFSDKLVRTMKLPETLLCIEPKAFIGCASLQSISFPSALKQLGEGAFAYCTSLKEVRMEASQVIDIANSAFAYCSALSQVTFPLQLNRIGASAFIQSKSLNQIEFPSNLRVIDLDAFRNSGLQEVKLSNNICKIRQRAFQGCSQLRSVMASGEFTPYPMSETAQIDASAFADLPLLEVFEIPKGVTDLDQNILSNSPLLTEIVIPETVKTIKFHAFQNMSIEKVRLLAPAPPAVIFFSLVPDYWNAFPETARFQVSADHIGAYRKAAGWNQYASKMEQI